MSALRKTMAQRFEDKVMPIPFCGCHVWMGSSVKGGYGTFSVNGKMRMAHRVAWELSGRTIPDGLDLEHKCRVRCCVNPDHLEPVTRLENIMRGILPFVTKARMALQSAARTHCSRGHLLAGDNLYREKAGRRRCRACVLMAVRGAYAKGREGKSDGRFRWTHEKDETLRAMWSDPAFLVRGIANVLGMTETAITNRAWRLHLPDRRTIASSPILRGGTRSAPWKAEGSQWRRARLDLDLTQQQVAAALGVSLQAVSMVERGINKASQRFAGGLARLCDELNGAEAGR